MRDEQATKIMEYMRAHWPSKVRSEWQVGDEMYVGIVKKILADWTEGVTREKRFFRIAGQSGSGKTTQLLPAVEVWFAEQDCRPIFVTAGRFVDYHPFAEEIEVEYGSGRLREMTDEVSTILMFLVLRELIKRGYDMILDVTLLDPLVESFLTGMLREAGYESRMSFVAVSKVISDEFIAKRQGKSGRVVAKSTAAEFWRATDLALQFYIREYPKMRVLIYNAWNKEPVFDGRMGDADVMRVVRKYWKIDEVPVEVDEEALALSKIEYMRKWR
ncbi:zeta toxin family protein [Candidatus Saccharibacteria bacterium]|nr:zeta toxin family protein [Candidatus Saccharibacteria bacterium]